MCACVCEREREREREREIFKLLIIFLLVDDLLSLYNITDL